MQLQERTISVRYLLQMLFTSKKKNDFPEHCGDKKYFGPLIEDFKIPNVPRNFRGKKIIIIHVE